MSETADIARRAVEGGFADPVFDAQAVFASLLQAMSRPGTIVDFGKRCTPPAPLSPAQGAILCALADADTPVFVEGGNDPLVAWLGFQTGARLAEPQEARFAVVGRFDQAALKTVPLGTLTYPDRSATLLVEVVSLEGGEPLRVTGPGIASEASMRIDGLGCGFLQARQANRALNPCGLDLILTAGSRALCLPRSTIVTEG